jgi:hypothetical protein
LEKTIRRKGRRNLSKLQKNIYIYKKKRGLGFLKVRTQPLGASKKKKERKGEKGIKKEDDGLIML